jgi:hypothetical protein
MLNYFLLQLVGPQRKSLTLKDPEKYEFRPKQLLEQVSLILQFQTGELSPATAVTSLLFLRSPLFCFVQNSYFNMLTGCSNLHF